MFGLVKSILVSTFDKTDEASLIISIIIFCGMCKYKHIQTQINFVIQFSDS